MHASQHDRNNVAIPVAPGTVQKRRKTMRVTFVTDGTWFDIQGDLKEEAGVELHLATDGDSAELTIRTDEENVAFPALRIFRDRSA